MHSVVTRTGEFGGGLGNDLGDLLEPSAVVRHESDAAFTNVLVASQDADFLDLGVFE